MKEFIESKEGKEFIKYESNKIKNTKVLNEFSSFAKREDIKLKPSTIRESRGR